MTFSVRVGVCLTLALLLTAFLSAQNTKNVLVLHVGNANQSAHLIVSKVFRDVFGADTRNQLFEEFLDQDRLRPDDKTLVESLGKKYAGKHFDLIITIAAPPLMFLLRHGEELWPGTPKVFSFVEPRELPAKLLANMTGITSPVDFSATLDLALRLMPNTRHVFYLGGSSPREKVFHGIAERDFSRFAGKIDATYLDDLPLSELLVRLGQLPENSIVIFFTILQDATGHVYTGAQVGPMVTSASKAPVYGIFDTNIGSGVVGGVILDVEQDAQQAARLGLRVLERGTAEALPIQQSTPSRTVVDWRQLQRWGIREKQLPSGTIVRFRTPSVWEQYKWYLLAGLAAIAAQFALILKLVVEMRRGKKSNLAINSLTGRLITASEEERKRIARELHDDVGQRLSLVCMDLNMMESDSQNKATAKCSLHQSLQQLNEIVTDVHSLSHQLHSSKLQMLGLEVALREVCQQLARQHEMDVQLTTEDIPFPLREDLALCFYRVAQEALNNSVKHSGSARAEVRVAARDGTLRMTIKDYGAGFDNKVAADGLGLATMRERLKLVEGDLLVNSKPGGGTEVTAQARLDPSFRQNTAA
jgi:signal transduction histidine kinase